MTQLFVSDLHLDPTRPDITAQFIELLRTEGPSAEALYVLGDLFEAWLGDDDLSEPGNAVAAALRNLSDSGIPVFLLRGNRDVLLGQAFAARSGATLLPDPCVIDLYGEPTLLSHGDQLCTDDASYQAFRKQVRDPAWQENFLSQSLAARQAFAAKARAASIAHQSSLNETGALASITDVNTDAVKEMLSHYGVQRMIHGHTHRPSIHSLSVRGQPATRIVLGDWYEQGSLLRVSQEGIALVSLPPN